MTYILKVFFFAFLSLSILAPFAAVALEQPTDPDFQPPTPIDTTAELFQRVDTVVQWVFAAIILLSIMLIILGAFEFVTAAGDPTKVATARQRLIWAAVGIGVAMLARAIPLIVKNIVA